MRKKMARKFMHFLHYKTALHAGKNMHKNSYYMIENVAPNLP
jgi:hypothetical protein